MAAIRLINPSSVSISIPNMKNHIWEIHGYLWIVQCAGGGKYKPARGWGGEVGGWGVGGCDVMTPKTPPFPLPHM